MRLRAFAGILTWIFLMASSALGAPTSAGPRPVSSSELLSEIQSRITKVEEFKYLRGLCQELKIRCWIFGGTAAGYGHYVKWDLQRLAGDARFQPDRFDHDYTNIFRSTQDADIVIDGSDAQAAQIEARLRDRFPHFQGSKDIWEVRLLSKDRGDKEALLNNKDFLRQHTDSNSTGMIEITEPLPGESVVRDLRDWKPRAGEHPQFFRDIFEGKLHFYFSELHSTTSRFKQGLNPPILSAIRFLTKAFQYDLEIRPEDRTKILEIIRDFDPRRDLDNEYLKKWVERNGKKIFQHAVNIEYAWNETEALGLRKKLRSFGDRRTEESLAWWMDRKPLRSAPLSVPRPGETTARDLFEQNRWAKPGEPLVVAHETRSYLAHESITRAHTGDANVFVSRETAIGEAAAYGEGFYTRVGRQGAVGSGLTIRFELHPDAVLDRDFFIANGHYVVVTNKKAIRVIPESLNLTPIEYVRFLAEGQDMDPSDRALFEKFRRRIQVRYKALSAADLKQIEKVIPLDRPEGPAAMEYVRILGENRGLDSALRWMDGLAERLPAEKRTAFIPTALTSLPDHQRSSPRVLERIRVQLAEMVRMEGAHAVPTQTLEAIIRFMTRTKPGTFSEVEVIRTMAYLNARHWPGYARDLQEAGLISRKNAERAMDLIENTAERPFRDFQKRVAKLTGWGPEELEKNKFILLPGYAECPDFLDHVGDPDFMAFAMKELKQPQRAGAWKRKFRKHPEMAKVMERFIASHGSDLSLMTRLIDLGLVDGAVAETEEATNLFHRLASSKDHRTTAEYLLAREGWDQRKDRLQLLAGLISKKDDDLWFVVQNTLRNSDSWHDELEPHHRSCKADLYDYRKYLLCLKKNIEKFQAPAAKRPGKPCVRDRVKSVL